MESIIPKLNPEQKRAAEAPAAPLLIVAGAGTGKTRTLTSRIVHLIDSGTPPERICAITFTNKAAQEMAERVTAMLGNRPSGLKGSRSRGNAPYIGTFHSLGARILRRECGVFGREPNFVIFDDHDSFDLIKKAVKASLPKKDDGSAIQGARAGIRLKQKKYESPAFFAQKISEMKNLELDKGKGDQGKESKGQIDTGHTGTNVEETLLVKKVFDAYEAALRRNNAFDFDDLIEKPVAMFAAHPEILRKHQGRFDAILVDEYQDINPKQYELVRYLAGAHRNLTVVGDDEQTIYTWRYADIKIFLDFDKDWPGASVHFLEENYRSSGNVVRGASSMVQNNSFRTPKKLWTQRDGGEPITLYEAWGENDEAAWIAQSIVLARRRGAAGSKTPTIAILYRTNAQSRAIEQALIRESISYKIFGGLKFYERREVKDAVAALRYASNQRDELSRERLEKNLSKRKFAEFRAALQHTIEVPGTTAKPTDIIKIFLETFGYFDYLESNFTNADERQENIAELVDFASGFDDLAELLERLSLLQATDDENAAAKSEGLITGAQGAKNRAGETVHLSTVHMAKGLEFDMVFIAGAAEGLLPHSRSIENNASLEEERQLMYVAMTRAKEKLSISFYGLPSRFIGEIPEEHTHFESADDDEVNEKSGAGRNDDGRTTSYYRDYDDEVDDREKYIEF
jgi:DNA helicase-2/ATP-dependent DNA helicase PcrA